jgi:hypothetical protein
MLREQVGDSIVAFGGTSVVGDFGFRPIAADKELDPSSSNDRLKT